jgi:3-hydroxyisobutyrate dehydrogenase-like beta-hydroxyacid dehydrogenase
MAQKIGFIGLGNLGAPIALNLLEAGHELYVYNRTISKTKPLAEKGAKVCKTVGELAEISNIIFTVVSDDAVLKSLCNSEDGLLKKMPEHGLHISLSTILPKTAAELENLHQQNGQRYLASPVFGRPEAVTAKKLNYVISGNVEARSLAIPLLKDSGGINVWDFGETVTAANTVKLCGNFLIAGALEAIGESVLLATNSGIDPNTMWNMFSQTLFSSPIYANYSNIILQRKFEPAAFTAKLGLKDINLVLEQAHDSHSKMPLAQFIQKRLDSLIKIGHENIDWSAVALVASETSTI